MKQAHTFVTQLKLTLVVFGDPFNPIDFTKDIGVEPSDSWLKGDLIDTYMELRKGKSMQKRKESAWEYSIGFISSLDFSELTLQFERIFEGKTGAIKKYVENNQLEVTVNAVIEIANGETPSLNLSKEFISFIHDLGAELDFDLYLLEDE
ncbi:hypothetical protein C900_02125 [Fulvivirga imtechensis AK7]|uniref:DUF4279 domain-containing protein n=1 Tax=Fulvivirga imtechensis AK7 TaxID=1237149 RepID=L8JSW0_9BACT|nr:DUF4279 domain-containing protein [Fulvivirga imtechensis]ELR71940.1 hypothetical protein C900_02125 [Fulvivirga imtechensis AK7]